MNELALFAGAGGGLLGSRLLGWRTVCAVENDPYRQAVLLARQADGILDPFPIWEDVRDFDGRPWRGIVDVVTAGFPCQPFSVAGRRRGADDERNLWPETIRVIREVGPRYALLENVPGLLAHGYFGTILGELAEAGYDARWCVLGADDVGAPHRRKRLWILGHTAQLFKHGGDYQSASGNTQIPQPRNASCSADVADSKSNGLEGTEPTIGTTTEVRRRFAKPSWWAVEPDMGRVAHGVVSRVDRLAGLGDGQVPLCAAFAFQLLVGDQQ